jgi:phosphoglycolate phosphatase
MIQEDAYPETVVFDLDGTLIDSVPAIRVALNQVLNGEGFEELSINQVTEIVGFGANWMVGKIYETHGRQITPEKLDDVMAWYLDAYMANSAEHTVVYDGVYDVLAELKSAGVKMGVCTNKPGITTRPVLESLKLDHFFGAMVTEDDVEHRKPDGRHVLETIKAVGGDVSQTVFVGDSETDMAAAENAGVAAICVTYGYCHVPYADLKAEAFLGDFNELPKTLLNLYMTAQYFSFC